MSKAKKRKREAERLGLGNQDWYFYDMCPCRRCQEVLPERTAALHTTVGGRGEVGRLVDREKSRRKRV